MCEVGALYLTLTGASGFLAAPLEDELKSLLKLGDERKKKKERREEEERNEKKEGGVERHNTQGLICRHKQ